MDWMEEELERALARTAPPPGFAERILAEARRRNAPVPVRKRWAIAAAALLAMAGSSFAWREHRGAVARREVMLAVRITAVRLNRIQAQVREAAR